MERHWAKNVTDAVLAAHLAYKLVSIYATQRPTPDHREVVRFVLDKIGHTTNDTLAQDMLTHELVKHLCDLRVQLGMDGEPPTTEEAALVQCKT